MYKEIIRAKSDILQYKTVQTNETNILKKERKKKEKESEIKNHQSKYNIHYLVWYVICKDYLLLNRVSVTVELLL